VHRPQHPPGLYGLARAKLAPARRRPRAASHDQPVDLTHHYTSAGQTRRPRRAGRRSDPFWG